jgi:hypothetical protein
VQRVLVGGKNSGIYTVEAVGREKKKHTNNI